jgi:hypothetical protein
MTSDTPDVTSTKAEPRLLMFMKLTRRIRGQMCSMTLMLRITGVVRAWEGLLRSSCLVAVELKIPSHPRSLCCFLIVLYPFCNNGRRLHRSAVVSSRVGRSASTERPNPRTAPCPRCMYWCGCFGPIDGIQATEAFHKLQPASIREELGGFRHMVRESLSRVSRASGDGGENEALLPRNNPANTRESARGVAR